MTAPPVRTRHANGEVIHDSSLFADPPLELFDLDQMQREQRLCMQTGGRGKVAFVESEQGTVVVRHYRRGGLLRRLTGDRYLWTGGSHTRSIREFQLLVTMFLAGLPVARPVVARYQRCGLIYRADLVTCLVAGATTLAQHLGNETATTDMMTRVARTLARFHREGVFHADLNAHNILFSDDDDIVLIDFDRGRLQTPRRAWQQRNINRLRRSLVKLSRSAEGAKEFGTVLQRTWLGVMGYDRD